MTLIELFEQVLNQREIMEGSAAAQFDELNKSLGILKDAILKQTQEINDAINSTPRRDHWTSNK